VKDEAGTFRQSGRGGIRLAPARISQPYKERRDSRRGFPAEPVTTPAGAATASVFDLPIGPAHIVLYQKNIEAVCSSEAEVRQQIRQTLMHELGHYFGMTEEQLRDV
jgi:hypothetical protein